MKIESAGMQLASSHASLQHHEIRESLRMWVGDRRPDFEGRGAEAPRGRPDAGSVTLSDAGRAAQGSEAAAIEDSLAAAEKDPRLMLLRAMFFLLTGREADILDAEELKPEAATPDVPAPPPEPSAAAGYGVEYDYHESYTEVEQTTFSANGVVRTADGREIRFEIGLSMSRAYHEESSVSLRLGDAARPKKDPLVLNFSGTAAQLLDQRFRFDLDADGNAENINRIASGSGFLVFDRNGDGVANNGSELFGAQSGDGFAELSALDGDGNGWVDENDAAYADLRVWTPDATGGGDLRTLREANVGAIATVKVATPFSLKDGANDTLGQVRSTGLYLQESGEARTVQQIDFSV